MKRLLLLAAASSLGLTACARTAKSPRSALDCPPREGRLMLAKAAEDGKSCLYNSAQGAQVNLELLPVDGDPGAALDALEARLVPPKAGAADPARAAVGSITVDADKAKDTARVKVGPVTVNTGGGSAKVSIRREVKTKGSREKDGLRASYIVQSKDRTGGRKLLGYEAAGPKTGPLVVAVMRAPSNLDANEDLQGEAMRLVRRNAGL